MALQLHALCMMKDLSTQTASLFVSTDRRPWERAMHLFLMRANGMDGFPTDFLCLHVFWYRLRKAASQPLPLQLLQLLKLVVHFAVIRTETAKPGLRWNLQAIEAFIIEHSKQLLL